MLPVPVLTRVRPERVGLVSGVVTAATITCPACGAGTRAEMPTDACLFSTPARPARRGCGPGGCRHARSGHDGPTVTSREQNLVAVLAVVAIVGLLAAVAAGVFAVERTQRDHARIVDLERRVHTL